MKKTLVSCYVIVCGFFFVPDRAQGVNFTWSIVGDTGNPSDPDNSRRSLGSVSYDYRISRFEVTNAQYVEFLNSVDPLGANSHSLYSSEMTLSTGISFSSSNSVGQKYGIGFSDFNHRPVNNVTWNSAARFVNWLNNGQGSGDTEFGSYDMTLVKPFSAPTRLLGAKYVLPSHDEWYKAAYYAPGSASANGDDYWFYPTQSDNAPVFEEIPPGGANSANVGTWTGIGIPITEIGAYSMTESYYGLFDMAGNVDEWVEDHFFGEDLASHLIKGGSFFSDRNMRSDDFSSMFGESGNFFTGFRVAMIPEPSSVFLCLLGFLILLSPRTARRK
ncbi:MAG: SUMF1/EgtB/PvdO family nonheme iron enzyme [Verrucomicrobiales bacterium]